MLNRRENATDLEGSASKSELPRNRNGEVSRQPNCEVCGFVIGAN
jgi:hypothetical protein